MSNIASRSLNDSIEIDLSSLATSDQYRLVRQERDYPEDETDGWLITSGTWNDVTDSDTYEDDLNIKEGVYYYYRLYVYNISVWECTEEGMTLATNTEGLSEVFTRFFPYVFLEGQSREKNTIPFWKEGVIDPIFGEIVSLINGMGVELDYLNCSPSGLQALFHIFNWFSTQGTSLREKREEFSNLFQLLVDKGQRDALTTFAEDLFDCSVVIQEWIFNLAVSNKISSVRVPAFYVVAVGDGGASYSGTLADLPRRGTVIVTDGTETFTDDGLGVLTGDAGGTGTVNYDTGAYSIVFNSVVAVSTDIWTYYWFNAVSCSPASAEVQTRVGSYGDMGLYGISQDPESRYTGVTVGYFVYFRDETGIENGSNLVTLDKIYVNDLMKKERVLFPFCASHKWIITERMVQAVTLDPTLGDIEAGMIVEREFFDWWQE